MHTNVSSLKKLRKWNNRLDKQLSEENNEVMLNMVVYLRMANISERNQEDVRHDLLQMVLSAQERGERIDTVIGEDYKTFCDDIIAALPPKSRSSHIFSNLDIALHTFLTLSIIKISVSVFEMIYHGSTGRFAAYQMSISVGDLMAAIAIPVIASAIVDAVGRSVFAVKPERSKIARFFLGGAIGGAVGAFFLLTLYLRKLSLFSVPILLAGGVVLAAYGLHKVCTRLAEQ